MKTTKRTAVWLDSQSLDWLDAEAQRQQTTRSHVVRQLAAFGADAPAALTTWQTARLARLIAQEPDAEVRRKMALLVQEVAQEDNPRFDRNRFEKACNL